jgi:hypothetical protein
MEKLQHPEPTALLSGESIGKQAKMEAAFLKPLATALRATR